MVEHVIERSGLIAHYESEREGQERIENLRELVNAAAAYLADAGVDAHTPANVGVAGPADAPAAADTLGMTPLEGFLSHASLEAGDNQASAGSDALQLMTVHSAKGLEFDAVFITGLEEGIFPHENSVSEIDGLEEERRLAYVAITRARQRLYLSMSQTRMLHGQTRYSMRSRFFDELPPESLKWLSPRASAGAWASGQRSAWREPAPARTPASGYGSDNGTGLRVGMAVRHQRFGEGVIIDLEGRGEDARAQVNFGPAGVKWLALAIAKLDRL